MLSIIAAKDMAIINTFENAMYENILRIIIPNAASVNTENT